MTEMILIFKAAFSILLLAAAFSDVRRFSIPNILPLLVLLLFAAAWPLGFPFNAPLWSHLLHFAVALGIGMLLFRFGWFGGGDVKLYAAIALWFGFGDALLLLLLTSLTGAIIVVVRLTFHLLRGLFRQEASPGQGRTRLRDRKIAYGIAIAAGGISSLLWIYQ